MALNTCHATSAIYKNDFWNATSTCSKFKKCILIKPSVHTSLPVTPLNPLLLTHRTLPVSVSVSVSVCNRFNQCTFSYSPASSFTRANHCQDRNDRLSVGLCRLNKRRRPLALIPAKAAANEDAETGGDDDDPYSLARKAVWSAYGVYIFWLFLLPYAPISISIFLSLGQKWVQRLNEGSLGVGDPVWDIKWETLQLLLDLSQNFFFILPGLNALGIHFMEAPILHPTSECLFNFVNAWGFLFGPLLASDKRRKIFGGSTGLLWTSQMFLTNVFLIPYMALRLRPLKPNKDTENIDENSTNFSVSFDDSFRRGLLSNSVKFGIIGTIVGIISIFWFFIGRPESGFGEISERWHFFLNYVSEDRAAYAFLIDLGFYAIFQAWIIGDNLNLKDETEDSREKFLKTVRFLPFFGLAFYLIFSQNEKEKKLT